MSRYGDANAGPPWWGHDITVSLVNPNDPINFGLPGKVLLVQDPALGSAGPVPLNIVNWTITDIQANLPAAPPFDGPYALTLGLQAPCLNPTNPIGGIFLDPATIYSTAPSAYQTGYDIRMREDRNVALTPFILLPGADVHLDMYAWGTIWAGVWLTLWNPSVGWINYDAHESKFLLHGPGGQGKVDRTHPYGLMYGFINLDQSYPASVVQNVPQMTNQILAAPMSWTFPSDVTNRAASLRTNGVISWHWGDPSVGDPATRLAESDPSGPPQPPVSDPNLYSSIHLTNNDASQLLLVFGINDDMVGNGKGNFAINVHVTSGNVVYIPIVPKDPNWGPSAKGPIDWIRELPLRGPRRTSGR